MDQTRAYYDARASEYEEAYTLGTGTSSIRDPAVFTNEARILASIVAQHVGGRVIDVACGTGFWLPAYAERCSHVTLFDQSERMLDECRKKVERLGLTGRCTLLQGDFFEQRFTPASYDCALVGFLLSHLTEAQEAQCFASLKAMMAVGGRFLILESAWSRERAEVNVKAELQERRLNDGTRFEIYKRYFDRNDVVEWGRRYRVSLEIEHFGAAFVAVSGRV
ncbi:MAG TPA: class I SAM-dependent methyltransferase [Vicinamibacterales bacterium]|nr:class I SAM-dependent methyltransferase [Vicinamibacterales bacterium]